ncbi:MAG TPA: M28 family peptidase [Thermodesulfobacteriota bacterium]|nr:M28 family peptidase [Thermodesulfobacteriota bacterium]
MNGRIPLLIALLLLLIGFIGDKNIETNRAMVSVESLRKHVENLQSDRNPHEGYPKLEQAAQYIKNEFLKTGLEVKEDCFEWEGRSYKNIVAEKKGRISPGRVLILGAHYDTVPGSPGADDNASAVGVLLEIARNIESVSLEMTVRLIAFTLEEYGYLGSSQYVGSLKKGKEEILGMISLEMVGFTGPRQDYPPFLDPKYYPNVGDFIAIVGNERSEKLLERVCQSFKTHIPELPLEFLKVPGNGRRMEEVRLSDHSIFWDEGYAALLVTDTSFLRNRNYHLPSDTIDTLNFEFMQKVATGVYYSTVELAR